MKQGWTYKKLGDIAEIIHGKNQKDVISEDGQYPIYGSGGNVMGYATDYLCEANTTILGRKGSINNPQFITERFWNVDTAFGIFAKNGNDSKFIYYFIKSIDWSKKNTGTTLPSLTQQVVKSVELSVPPLAEQERIVERLDAAFAQIDELKSNAEKQLAEARALFQSALTQAMQPKPGWQEKTLKELSIIAGDYGLSVPSKPFDGVRYLRITDITEWGELNNEFVSADISADDNSKEKLEEGDILFARTGATVGKTLVYKKSFGECLFAGYLIRYRLNKKEIMPQFMHYITHSKEYYDWVQSNQKAAAQPNINAKKYNSYIVRYPKLSEQESIVAQLDALFARVYELEEINSKTAAECDALKQALLRQIFE